MLGDRVLMVGGSGYVTEKFVYPSSGRGGSNNRRVDLPHEIEGWEILKKEIELLASGNIKGRKELLSLNIPVRQLASCLDSLDLDDENELWEEILPFIATLALEGEFQFPYGPAFLLQQHSMTSGVSQRHAACLLSHAFLGTLSSPPADLAADMQHLTFEGMFQFTGMASPSKVKMAKVQCLLNYFRRLRMRSLQDGNMWGKAKRLTITRKTVGSFPSEESWLNCKAPLTRLTVDMGSSVDSVNPAVEETERGGGVKARGIEDSAGSIQADFANSFIGGGVLGDGNAQEEIRFVLCPEALVAMLLCPRMLPREAIVIVGCERFSSYRGYGNSFEYAGNYVDKSERDCWGRLDTVIVALDAIQYEDDDAAKEQYSAKHIFRELGKAYVAFVKCAAVAEPGATLAPQTLDPYDEDECGEGDDDLDSDGDYERPVAHSDVMVTATQTISSRSMEDRRRGMSDIRERRRVSFERQETSVRPVATGNWGCGAFGGDPQLKSLIQWAAAARCGREVVYFPFGDTRVARLEQLVVSAFSKQMSVGELLQMVLSACNVISKSRNKGSGLVSHAAAGGSPGSLMEMRGGTNSDSTSSPMPSWPGSGLLRIFSWASEGFEGGNTTHSVFDAVLRQIN